MYTVLVFLTMHLFMHLIYLQLSHERSTQIEDDSTVLSTVAFIQSVASIVIETAWRRYQAKKLVEAMRAKKRTGAATSSSSDRVNHSNKSRQQIVTRNEEEKKFESMAALFHVLAAIRIQSAFRGWWVRDCISVDHYCAKVIQSAYRAFRSRNEYLFDMYRIMMVQSASRRYIARVKVANIFGSVVLIQSACRGFLAKKKVKRIRARRKPIRPQQIKRTVITVTSPKRMKENRQSQKRMKEERAATTIQSQWRCFMVETSFIQTLVDILIVQSVIRRFVAIKKVKELRQYQRRKGLVDRNSRFQASRQVHSRAGRPPAVPIMETKKREWASVIKEVDEQAVDSNSTCSATMEEESSVDEEQPASKKADPPQEGAKNILRMWKERERQLLANGAKR